MLLCLVLVAAFAIVVPSELFSADEGAVVAQARALDDGSWSIPHPLPEVDPEGRWFPIELSVRTEEGFAPYAKHPLYPLILGPLDALGGYAGMAAFSVAGALLAAVAGAMLARRIDTWLAVPTLWVLGIASPLLFNGFLVIAHAPGAALSGCGALLALRGLGRGGRTALWLGASGLVWVLAVQLRSEAVLLGVAFALAVTLVAGRPWPTRAGAGALLGLSVLGGYLLDGAANQWVLGDQGVDPFTISSSDGSFVAERLGAFAIQWILPRYGADVGVGEALLLVVLALSLLLGWELRKRTPDPTAIRVLSIAGAVVAVIRFIAAPEMLVPGLLPAFPLFAVALVAWRIPSDETARVLGLTFGLFAGAVAATQYSSAGAEQWGGRYLVIALPLVVPVAVAQLARSLHRASEPARRVVVVSVAVVAVSLAASSVWTLRQSHLHSAQFVDDVAEATEGSSVVVTTRGATGRFLHEHLDGERWLLVPPEELDDALARLASAGIPDIVLVGEASELPSPAALPHYEYEGGSAADATDGSVAWRLEL